MPASQPGCPELPGRSFFVIDSTGTGGVSGFADILVLHLRCKRVSIRRQPALGETVATVMELTIWDAVTLSSDETLGP